MLCMARYGLYCTNWGIGRPARPLDTRPADGVSLYQLGNWKAGKTATCAGLATFSIVPTGELEGRQDFRVPGEMMDAIVPTGELEGRQDDAMTHIAGLTIVPTGELEGRQDSLIVWMDACAIVPTGELEGRQDCGISPSS